MGIRKTKLFIEALLLWTLSVIGLTEGYRLITHRDPHTLYDVLGPGLYIFVLSCTLLIATSVYVYTEYSKNLNKERIVVNKQQALRMMGMIIVLAIYIRLIDIFGYVISTVFFSFLEFRLAGVRSWITAMLLALSGTLVYYIVFIKYCSLIFPRGIFF